MSMLFILEPACTAKAAQQNVMLEQVILELGSIGGTAYTEHSDAPLTWPYDKSDGMKPVLAHQIYIWHVVYH